MLDPLAAILLITKSKWGVILTAIVIIVDVMHNSIVGYSAFSADPSVTAWIARYWMLACQIAFGLFVVATFKSNIRAIKSTRMHR